MVVRSRLRWRHLERNRDVALGLAAEQQYGALSSRLGSEDRARLGAHLEKVKALEQRLDAGSGLSCEIPEEPQMAGQGGDPEMGLDVLVHALACDLTRVASVRYTYWDSYPGVVGSYHDDHLHYVTQTPEAAATVQMVKQSQCQRIASFIDRLAAVQEGGGTLLDNTLVVWADEFCHGYSHAHHEVPYVLVSGSNRFFEMGRYLHLPQSVSNNRLWNSLIGAMDADGAGTFGDPQFDNTPLAL